MKSFKNDKQVLIVVDVINGFIREGALADRGIEKIIPEVVRLVERALDKDMPVAAFCDCHTPDSPELESFPSHCLKGSSESELVDELKPYEEKMAVMEKNSTSGYALPEFRAWLSSFENLERVIIVGCCTDICILNLAIPLKNHFNEIGRRVEIVVPQNAVDTYEVEGHGRTAFNEMSFVLMKQAGVQVPESVEI